MSEQEIDYVEYLQVAPYEIIKKVGRFNIGSVKVGEIAVRPLLAGICGSDVLYFRGQKEEKKLRERLPLVLLHEGVVERVSDGRRGVIVPLVACKKCWACANQKENLCTAAKFMGSTAPGLARSIFSYPQELILFFESEIPSEVATLTEPTSVAWNLVKKIDYNHDKIVVIGDGVMAYLCVVILSLIKKVPRDRLYVFGVSDKRLAVFASLAQIINTTTETGAIFLKKINSQIDVVIEAVGGSVMDLTLGQAIEAIRPEGNIVALGITDKMIPLKLNTIVNKGIRIRGESRSKIDDYLEVLKDMKNKEFHDLLIKIIDPKVFIINQADDLAEAFHYASSSSSTGRVIVKF